MEIQMKAICDGTRTRNDVVQQSLEQYRAVFARTTQQMDVLKAVSVNQFLNVISNIRISIFSEILLTIYFPTGHPELHPRTSTQYLTRRVHTTFFP